MAQDLEEIVAASRALNPGVPDAVIRAAAMMRYGGAKEQLKPENERSWTEAAGDMALKGAQGVVGLGQSVVGLGDIATGGMIGKVAEAAGYDPKRAKEMIASASSDKQKMLDRVVGEAGQNKGIVDGFVDQIGAIVDNPSVIPGVLMESLPSMLAAGGGARALGQRIYGAAFKEATAAGLAGEAAAAKAAQVLESSASALKWAAAGGEGALTTGQIADTARGEGRAWNQYVLPALAAGAGTAAIGRAAGSIPGLGDAETAAFTGVGRAAATGNRAIRTGKGMLQEGVIEEMPQSAQEQAFTNLATGKPIEEGVGAAAAQGLIAGTAMGGAMGAISSANTPTDNRRETPPDAAPPAEQRKQAIQDIATAPNVDAAIEAFGRATAAPAAPVDTGESIPYDYSTRQQMYPALPAPEMPSGRNVLVNDTDPQLTRPEQIGDREAAINFEQRQREQADSDRELGITRRQRITLDEAGNIVDAPAGDRQFLSLVRREARPHAAAAIEAHAINPTLTEAVLAAPDMGPKAERAVFEAITNGTTGSPETRDILARHGLADANGQGQIPLNPAPPGQQPAGDTGSERRPAENGTPGTGADAAADNRSQGVSPFQMRGKWLHDMHAGALNLIARNSKSLVERAKARAELDRRNPNREFDRAAHDARKRLWRAIVQAGGISEKEAADIGIDPRSLGGYRMSGLITPNGMRGDILARFLAESGNGWLRPDQADDDNAARQLVADLLAREAIGTPDEQNRYHELLAKKHGEAVAAAIDTLPEVEQAQVADYDDSVLALAAEEFDAALDAEPNMTVADAMRALGFTDEEIRNAEQPASEERETVDAETGRDEPGSPSSSGESGIRETERGEGAEAGERGDQEGAATAVVKRPDTQQDLSRREWQDNYDRVANAPDLSKISTKDIERAINYASHRLASEGRKGWDGGQANTALMDSIRREIDNLKFALKQRQAPAAKPPATTPRLYVQSPDGRRFEVESYEDASRKWLASGETEQRARNMATGAVPIVDQDGKTVALMGVNGRVTAFDGTGVLYAPPEADVTPAKAKTQARLKGQKAAGVAAPLYASRPVTNAADIIAWAQSQGFKTTLPAGDLHVTVAYSTAPLDGAAVPATGKILKVLGDKRSVEPLGDEGAVVLKFTSKALQNRWQAYRDAGASWDYDGYQPHITLTYDGQGVDLSKVEPYRGPINLGPEKQEPLNEDKADEYVEQPTSDQPPPTPVAESQAPQKPSGDTDATLARFKPREMVIFAKPFEGKTGAKLTGYQWVWTKVAEVDKRGEDRVIRVSDWERAMVNPETNREIVHQFQVVDTDGKLHVVSAESAANMLGVAQSTVRTNAVKLVEQQIREQEERDSRTREADSYDAMKAMPTPAQAIEQGDIGYAEIVRKRALTDGKAWGAEQDRYTRDIRAGREYRFLTRDGKFIFSPELVTDGSELEKRGWKTVELKARDIWDASGNDKRAPEAGDRGVAPAQEKGAAETAEQAIRAAVDAVTERTIGSWYPITVEFGGRAQQFLSNIKAVRSDGKTKPSVSLVQIRMGRMLSGQPAEPLFYGYRLTGKNELTEEGIPRRPSDAELARWERAFGKVGAAAEPITPDAAANMQRGDIVRDSKGVEYYAWSARFGRIDVVPLKDGKPEVYAGSAIRFALDDNTREANPEYRTDPLYLVRKAEQEKAAEPAPRETPNTEDAGGNDAPLASRRAPDEAVDDMFGYTDADEDTLLLDMDAQERAEYEKSKPRGVSWLDHAKERLSRINADYRGGRGRSFISATYGADSPWQESARNRDGDDLQALRSEAARLEKDAPAYLYVNEDGTARITVFDARDVPKRMLAFAERNNLKTDVVVSSLMLRSGKAMPEVNRAAGAKYAAEMTNPYESDPFASRSDRNGSATGRTDGRGTQSPGAGRRRTGLAVAEVQRIAQGISPRLVRVVQSTADLPDAAARFKSDVEGIRGVFIPATDEIYLIADNLHSPMEVAFVVMHEGLHRGLRQFFGNDIAPILSQIANTNAKVRKAAAEYQAKYNLGRLEAIEEVLADMANSASLKDLTGWDKLVAFIRKWMASLGERLGFELKFSDDMVELLVGAAAQRGLMDEPTAFDDAVAARYSEAAPTFYSALAAEVGAINARALSPAAWWQNIESLVKKGAVKADEVNWSGVEEWLSVQEGKVTKDAFLAHLREGGVKVETTVLGLPGSRPTLEAKLFKDVENPNLVPGHDYATPDSWVVFANGQPMYVADEGSTRSEALMMYSEAADDAFGDGQTDAKFTSWKLPGGDDYREVLLTLPENGAAVEAENAAKQEYRDAIRRGEGQRELDRLSARVTELALARTEKKPFRSTHWDQPNVVAHFRADVVTGADGKRYLRPFEFQSDWGQKGKKEGFNPNIKALPDGFTVGKDGDYSWNVWSETGMPYATGAVTQEQAVRNALAKINSGLPPAPFVTKTEAWLSLAIKRAIRMAADEGLDGVVFANGEQMAGLFDLSKQVQAIRYEWSKDTGLYTVSAKRIGERQFFGMGEYPAEKLEEVVGKDLAKKMADQVEFNRQKQPDADEVGGSFEGLDLKVGGEGMRAFYDKILPNVANDVLRKLGGGKVGMVSLAIDNRSAGDRNQQVNAFREKMYAKYGDGIMLKMTADEKAQLRALEEGRMAQPGFLLTDTLRERALGGLPLFSRLSDQLRGMNKDAGEGLFEGGPELDGVKPLTESKFYDRYYQHIDMRGRKDGKAEENAAAIMRDGFNSTNVNLAPISRGEPTSIIARKLMPQAGDVVYLVPRGARINTPNGYRIKAGWKPEPHEIIRVSDPSRSLYDYYREAVEGVAPDDAPLASRAPDETVAGVWDMLQSASTPAQARALAMNLFDNPNKFNLWDKTIGTQLTKARKNEWFRAVFDGLQAQQDSTAAFAIEAEAEAADVLARMEGIGEVKSALKSTFSKLKFEQGSILPQGERARDLRAVSKAIFSHIEGKTGVKQFVFTDYELKRDFDLNDRQIGLYRQARAAIDRSLDRYAQSLAIRMAQKFVRTGDLHRAGLDDTVTALTERLQLQRQVLEDQKEPEQSIEDMEARLAELEELRDAAPREILRSLQMGPDGEMRQEYANLTDTAATAALDREIRDLKKAIRSGDGFNPANRELDAKIEALDAALSKLPEIQEQANSLKDKGYAPAMRFGDYAVTATQDGETTFFTMVDTKTQANLLKMRLSQELPGATIRVNQVDKESYKLFGGVDPATVELFARFMEVEETDAFKKYVALATSSRSALKHMLERKGIAGFSDNLPRVMAAFITSNSRAAARNIHAFGVNDAMEAAQKNARGDVSEEAAKLVNYMNNPTGDFAKVRGFMFAYFMGGSVSSALVNLTQPVMMTAPYLSQFAGKKTAGIMARASKAAATGKVTGATKAALERAEAEGITDAHEYHQLMQEAEGGGSVASRALMKAWGSMFSAAERFNRRITFLAAFETAQGMTQAQLQAKGVGDAYEFAKDAVVETQGIYARHNRPNWARNPVGALALTFKQYSIAWLEFFARLPRKQQLLAVGLLILVAGIEGLPFAEDLEDLIDTIGQRMGYGTNSKKALRTAATNLLGEAGAQFALHGISGLAGLPMDVAGRLGMGNLIPGTKLLNPSTKEKARELAEIAGPAAGLAQKAGGLADGNFKEAMPKAFADAAKAWEMIQTGEYRDTRGRKVMDVDGLDALMKMIGFQPRDVAANTRYIGENMRDVDIVKRVEAEIAEQWAEGIRNKDVEESRAARERLMRWNAENPDLPIKITFAQVLRRVKQANLTRDERFMKTAPPELRRRLLAESAQ